MLYAALACTMASSLALSAVAQAAPLTSKAIHPASLRVVGNQVLTADGKVYIPEGISIYGGLEDSNYMGNVANDDAQIEAAAKYWHVNTIRLQVAESNLFTNSTPGKTYNENFLKELIKQVNLIRSLHAVAVINDQTEFTTRLRNPTETTVKFWRVMDATFGNHPYVIFDLFNEPSLDTFGGASYKQSASSPRAREILKLLTKPTIITTSPKERVMKPRDVWNVWQYGSVVSGVRYVGMQTLVNQIRAQGVNNVIWVEGPYIAKALPKGQHLLKGSNIVYAFHHVNLNWAASWNAIGNLAKTHAVVDGEWSQYRSSWAECYGRAYTNVPDYLGYLQKHHVGIIAWSLQADSLVQARNGNTHPTNGNIASDPHQASALRTPDKLLPDYSCTNRFGQGAGQLIMTYFSHNGAKYSPFTH